MKKGKLVIVNWGMWPETFREAFMLSKIFSKNVLEFKNIFFVLCPPSPFIHHVRLNVSQNKNISIGAQDIFYENKGRYTGQVSSKMLRSLGAKYVVIGHPEKRKTGETDEIINKKIKLAVRVGLKVILFVGERERDVSGNYFKQIGFQIREGLRNIQKKYVKELIIVYRPLVIVKENIFCETEEIPLFIKKVLVEMFGRDAGLSITIIYGGFIDKKNIRIILDNVNLGGLFLEREDAEILNFLKNKKE